MITITTAVLQQYEICFKRKNLPLKLFDAYKKWLRYYLDFCAKYPVPDSKSERVHLFCEKLREKKQTEQQRQQAIHAIFIYYEMQQLNTPLQEPVLLNQPDSLAATPDAGVFLDDDIAKKYPRAPKEFSYQWVFPQRSLTVAAETGELRRYHMHESDFQRALFQAVRKAKIPKRVTAHTFRHSYATHLLQANFDIRTIQTKMGHSSLKTTMIYTHCVPVRTIKEPKSPLDI